MFTKGNCRGISKNSGRISDAMKEPWCPQLRGYSRHLYTKLSQGHSNSATDIVKYHRMLKTIIKVLFRPFHYCTVYRRSGSVNEESPIPLSYKETSSQSRATQLVRPGPSDRKSDPKRYGSCTSRSSFLTHIGGNSYCNSCTERGLFSTTCRLPPCPSSSNHFKYSSALYLKFTQATR